MKKKTINAVITKKIEEWVATLPEDMRKEVSNNVIVTGGCIASMLLREKINDFDVYFKTYDTCLKVANHYVKRFVEERKKNQGIDVPIFIDTRDNRVQVVVKSAGIAGEDDSDATYSYFEGRPPAEAGDYVSEVMDDPGEIEDKYEEENEKALENESEGYRPVFMSTNAITLSRKLQIILRFYGDADKIHENFDFVHCTNYWTKKDGVVLRQDALESLLSRELRYIGSKYPVCSLIRVRKFIKRNWTINAGQIVKMAFQVSLLDLNSVEVLKEQLTGVDVAYFHQVIDLLQKKDQDRVDSAYLIEILDRLF